jgi:hypothetical protein
MTMEITVMNKKRYDELLAKIKFLEDCVAFTQNETASIKNLETQVAMLHGQVTAMQNSNNELAEIAFDESRFTDKLLEKVDDLARESARDTIDIDDIASEVANNLDVSEEVERCAERLGYVCEDKVQDLIEDYVNANGLVNEGQVEDLISDYIQHNCDFVEKDVTDQLHEDIRELREEMQEMKQDIIDTVVQTLINKLTAKENDHATGTHDYRLQVSGAANQSEGSSDAAAAA